MSGRSRRKNTSSTRKPRRPARIVQFKLTLLGIYPPIWRRIAVRDSTTLDKLHDLIQTAMGWTDSHMHQFIVGETYYQPTPVEDLMDDMPPTKDSTKTRLRDVVGDVEDRLLYEYDFGDGWLHELRVEQIDKAEPGRKYPACLAGQRACPPEDCGGPPGYEHLLHLLQHPDDPDHDELTEWLGEDFDPEVFDLEATDLQMRPSTNRGRWARRPMHQPKMLVAVGWYRPEDWQRLREISEDRKSLEDTHREWLDNAVELMRKFHAIGINATSVEVDPEQLKTWCQNQGLPVNNNSRAQYASVKAREMFS